MTHKISEDRRTLTISVDDKERAFLSTPEARETNDLYSDSFMHDFLEPLVCNSDLEWINPADTGDLTDAPMLGILGSPETSASKYGPHGVVLIGKSSYQPILERWAFMDYQVRSVLEDLRDKGEAVFVGGAL